MKRLIILVLLLSTVLQLSNAQSKRKSQGPHIYGISTLNYVPPVAPYTVFSNLIAYQDLLMLNFITPNSGTFVIEEGILVDVNRELVNTFPSQLINIGAGIQIVNYGGLFHQISLTKLSISKSSYVNNYSYGMGNLIRIGYEQNTAVIAARYEFGRFFGKRKGARAKFGISGAVEPSYYRFKRKPVSTHEYPVAANIFALDIALIPTLSTKLSKRISLDFKFIPNILIADFGKIIENNPTQSSIDQEGIREYNLPEFNMGGSIQLKYLFKEPKKRYKRTKTDQEKN